VNPIERVRARCLGLPESFVETWDHPTFRLGRGRGKIFCTAASDGSSLTVKADPVEREALLTQGEPFFVPAYVGSKGWVGIRLDHAQADWEEVARRSQAHPARQFHVIFLRDSDARVKANVSLVEPGTVRSDDDQGAQGETPASRAKELSWRTGSSVPSLLGWTNGSSRCNPTPAEAPRLLWQAARRLRARGTRAPSDDTRERYMPRRGTRAA
jgi:hypothetical protein